MKVILKEDVFKLGSLGDEVEVKPGYARNYLIPQGKALPFTRLNVKQINHLKNLLAKQRADAINKAQNLAERLENTEIVFTMKAGESGKLFGSVTPKHIFDALQEQEIELDRKKLHLAVPIKSLGTHTIQVKLHSEVTAAMEVKVVPDEVITQHQPTEEGAEAAEKPAEEAVQATGEEAPAEAAATAEKSE